MSRRSLSTWAWVAAGAMLVGGARAQEGLIGPPLPEVGAPHVAGPGDASPASNAPQARPDPGAREKSQGLGPAPTGDRAASGAAVRGPGSVVDSIARTAAALAGVVGLAFAARWVAKRMPRLGGGLSSALGTGGRAPSGVLSVLGRYPTGAGQQLVLLRLDRRVLLLSQAGGRGRGGGPAFRTLAELTDPEEVASIIERTEDEGQASLRTRFQGLLSKFGGSTETYATNAEFPTSRQVVYGEDGDRVELLDDRTPEAWPEAGDEEPVGMDALSERLARYRAGQGGATWSA